jgi:hypothetical protein
VRGQSHTPAAIYPRERPGTHCTGGWVGPRAGLNRCGKSRPSLEFDSRTFQHVASRYTDYATRATKLTVTDNKFLLFRWFWVQLIAQNQYIVTWYTHCCVSRSPGMSSALGRVSSVGIVSRYGLDGPRIESRWGRDCLHPSILALRPTQPPIQ